MEWYAIIFWFGWVVPSVVGFLRLFFDKERGSIKFFFTYCWWAFIPFWNIILVYFVIKEFKDWTDIQRARLTVWYHAKDEESRDVFEYAVKVWGAIIGAVILTVSVYYIIFKGAAV